MLGGRGGSHAPAGVGGGGGDRPGASVVMVGTITCGNPGPPLFFPNIILLESPIPPTPHAADNA